VRKWKNYINDDFKQKNLAALFRETCHHLKQEEKNGKKGRVITGGDSFVNNASFSLYLLACLLNSLNKKWAPHM